MNHTLTKTVEREFRTYEDTAERDEQEVRVAIHGFLVHENIRDLQVQHLGKLVCVTGVVTKRSQLNTELKRLFLRCGRCGFPSGPFDVQEDKDLKPGSCAECQSKGPCSVDKELTLYGNHQKIMLQESPGKVEPGKMPRSKEVILTGDMVDTVRPGDEPNLTGIYRCLYDLNSNARHCFPVYQTQIDAVHARRKGDLLLLQITDEEVAKIRDLAKSPNVRERIINSIAPSIYGMEHVKTGIALSMFGGMSKTAAGRHRIRGDINVLVVGDPGLAKSQFLKYVEQTSQRAVYTSGKGASAVGLTAAVTRDEHGEFVLEGGALVLADSGICLIDEFDKMNDQDRTSIHEAMEQQSISISKAGIITTLSARCAVIAAANPIGGRYDSQLTFSENVELTDPILSRFDIICVLKDEVDAGKDEQLAEFVVVSHMRSHPTDPDTKIKSRFEQARENAGKKQIPQELLKKYILYARSQIMPKVSDVDNAKISKFYSEIRRESFQTGGVPMTVRHLESIVRIAEANARMELREFVSTRDVDHAIATMLECFIQTQKHQVAEKLRSRFSRYLGASADQSTLCKHLLEKELRRVSQLAQLAFDYDAASSPTVKQNIFLSVAERHQVRDAAVNFLRSEAFTGPAPEYEFVERPEDENQAAQAPGDRLIRRIQT